MRSGPLYRVRVGMVGRNLVALVAARAAAAVCGLVSLPIVYDRLGPHDFGIWAVLSGIVALVAIADLGLSSLTIRQVAANHAVDADDGDLVRTNAVLGIALLWGVLLALGGMGLVLVGWSWIADVLRFEGATDAGRSAALLLLAGLLADGVAQPWRAVLEGSQRYPALATITGTTAVGSAVLTIVAVRAGGGLVSLAVVVAGVALVRGALTVVAARRAAAAFTPRTTGIGRADVRAAASYGLPVQMTNVTGAVNLDLDRMILSATAGPTVAGGFELGSRVVNLVRIVPVYGLVVLFPMAVTRAADLGASWLDRFNVVVTRAFAVVGAIGTAALVAGAGPLVQLWLGEPNRDATRCIQVVAPAYAFNLAAGATGILSRVEGHPGRETGYAVLTAVANVALTWPLYRAFGPIGIPLATAVAVVFGTAYFLVSYHRATDRPLGPVVRAVVAPVVAGVIATGVGLAAVALLPVPRGRPEAAAIAAAAVAAAATTALIIVVATGALRRDDLTRLRAWARTEAGGAAVATAAER